MKHYLFGKIITITLIDSESYIMEFVFDKTQNVAVIYRIADFGDKEYVGTTKKPFFDIQGYLNNGWKLYYMTVENMFL